MAEEMLRQASESEQALKQARRYEPTRPTGAGTGPSLGSELARAAVKQLNSRQGQALVRGILGSLFKGR